MSVTFPAVKAISHLKKGLILPLHTHLWGPHFYLLKHVSISVLSGRSAINHNCDHLGLNLVWLSLVQCKDILSSDKSLTFENQLLMLLTENNKTVFYQKLFELITGWNGNECVKFIKRNFGLFLKLKKKILCNCLFRFILKLDAAYWQIQLYNSLSHIYLTEIFSFKFLKSCEYFRTIAISWYFLNQVSIKQKCE